MKLGYLPTANANSPKAGLGFGMAAIGKSIASVGKLADDDKKYNDKLALDKATGKRADAALKVSQDSLALKQKEYDHKMQIFKDEKQTKEVRRNAGIDVFMIQHPKMTKELGSRENIAAYMDNVDLYRKKDDFKFINAWVDGNKNKIIAYREGGKTKKINMGSAHVYGNGKEDTTDDYIKVSVSDFKNYGHTGKIIFRKDGYYIHKKDVEYFTSGQAEKDDKLIANLPKTRPNDSQYKGKKTEKSFWGKVAKGYDLLFPKSNIGNKKVTDMDLSAL